MLMRYKALLEKNFPAIGNHAMLLLICIAISGQLVAQRPASFNEFTAQSIVHTEKLIVIENVLVIDGTGSPVVDDQHIHIRDGIIEAINSEPGSNSAIRIDGEGKTIIPGLVMFHEHLLYNNATVEVPNYTSEALAMPPLYLAGGATTIRTAGTMDGQHDIQVRNRINAGLWPGPDIHITAPYIEGQGSFAYQMAIIEDPALARQFVRYWTSMGATSFKAYNYVSRAVLGAVIDEAHTLGVRVTGHLCSITFEEASNLGIDNLEHGIAGASDLAEDKKDDQCPAIPLADRVEAMRPDNPKIQRLIELLIENETAITSTLPVFAAGVHPAIPTQESLDLLSPRSKSAAEAVWESFLATLNGARYLDIADEVGSIAPGKRANLVLIEGNPGENISDIQNVVEVFKDGVGYDPQALKNSVRGTVGR